MPSASMLRPLQHFESRPELARHVAGYGRQVSGVADIPGQVAQRAGELHPFGDGEALPVRRRLRPRERVPAAPA